ncbi:phosphatidylethanolamine-binding protein, putative [Trypanosoma equiperdum]|uniref:Phosphatidylethanolamine-binding protein, putative n=1 Tax=Trypanosoma equiperdum TaxID=5694 RepID=A0A1G4I239_TRYEQ|nr:phosphatidylethanolamine-binding protein, putative [Trypanosoma equiperdum]
MVMRRCSYNVHPTWYMMPLRAYHMPGWKTKVSTKDVRTREQREADRKVRQIEKLPRPQALHDFQYPYEKTVLSDTMFQYPVYENELDTPHLFNITEPPDFFVYWNVSDFERTSYPPLPEEDHRLLLPLSGSAPWKQHRKRSLKYLRKHEILPNYLPHVRQDVNLSVVFPGVYATRARLCEETGELLPPPPPVSRMTHRNFWMTAHCGNYIELADLQHPPSIFFLDTVSATGQGKAVEKDATEEGSDEVWYTLIIASPDYPFRVPASVDASTQRGFFLNYMMSNLKGGGNFTVLEEYESKQRQNNQKRQHLEELVRNPAPIAKEGDVIVSYTPPLPTEDAGTTRHICMLFKQRSYVSGASCALDDSKASFAARANFRLHAQHRDGIPSSSVEMLSRIEQVLPPDPSAVTFFQTKWDIQVQEFYESRGMLEPAAPLDEEIEAILAYHARKPSELRVRARHRPDGSTNVGDDPIFWAQAEPTRMMDGSMLSLWSRRTTLGANGVPITYRR